MHYSTKLFQRWGFPRPIFLRQTLLDNFDFTCFIINILPSRPNTSLWLLPLLPRLLRCYEATYYYIHYTHGLQGKWHHTRGMMRVSAYLLPAAEFTVLGTDSYTLSVLPLVNAGSEALDWSICPMLGRNTCLLTMNPRGPVVFSFGGSTVVSAYNYFQFVRPAMRKRSRSRVLVHDRKGWWLNNDTSQTTSNPDESLPYLFLEISELDSDA